MGRPEERFLEQLKKLRERVETGGLKDPRKIQRAIGRTLQKNPRVARYYAVELTGTDTDRAVQWSRTEQQWHGDSSLLGCYVLRTNQQALSAERLVYCTESGDREQQGRSSSKFTRYSGSNIAVCHNQT